MNRRIPLLLALLVAALASGCVSSNLKTVRLSAPQVTAADGAFTAWMPTGWVVTTLSAEDGSVALASVDGPPIQYILLRRHVHKKAFAKLERDSSADLLPTELAETMLAELRKQDETEHLELMENAPATIAGHPGVVLQIRFRTSKGLEIQRRLYAFVDAQGIYTLSYQAPTLHFFARDLASFEHTVQSFRTGS